MIAQKLEKDTKKRPPDPAHPSPSCDTESTIVTAPSSRGGNTSRAGRPPKHKLKLEKEPVMPAPAVELLLGTEPVELPHTNHGDTLSSPRTPEFKVNHIPDYRRKKKNRALSSLKKRRSPHSPKSRRHKHSPISPKLSPAGIQLKVNNSKKAPNRYRTGQQHKPSRRFGSQALSEKKSERYGRRNTRLKPRSNLYSPNKYIRKKPEMIDASRRHKYGSRKKPMQEYAPRDSKPEPVGRKKRAHRHGRIHAVYGKSRNPKAQFSSVVAGQSIPQPPHRRRMRRL